MCGLSQAHYWWIPNGMAWIPKVGPKWLCLSLREYCQIPASKKNSWEPDDDMPLPTQKTEILMPEKKPMMEMWYCFG